MSARLERIAIQEDYIFISACKGCEYVIVYRDELSAILGAKMLKKSAKVKRVRNVLFVKFKKHDGVYMLNASLINSAYEIRGGAVVGGICR